MLRMPHRKSALTLIVLRSETLRSQLILSQRPVVHINWPRLKVRVLRYQTLCQLPNSPMLVIKTLKLSLLLLDVWHGKKLSSNQTTSGDVGFNWWVVQMIKHENWVFWRHKTGRWIHLQYINLPNMWRVDSLFFVFECLQINSNS